MDFKTLCIHGNKKKYDITGAISVPIFQSATFVHPAVGESTGYDYSRLQNPTREHLEITVAALENGIDCLAFSTGMSAMATMMELFSPGDHFISSDDLYGGSHRLFFNISQKNGLEFTLTNTADLENIKKALRSNTKAIFLETPTNPMMQVTDIRAVVELVKGKDILVIVDNTFLTPYLQKPLDLGADIALHSGTKYLGGHNDTLAGLLVVKSPELAERLRFIYKTTGCCLAPLDSWLIIRGLKTLALRMQRQEENAQKIVQWLLKQPKIKKVHYPGLKDHPQYEVSKRQAKGFGTMISFELDKPESCRQILEKVQVMQYAESLGGVESLITYPLLQTHADVPEEERNARGITDRLLRMSVGIEDIDDLLEDLKQALS